MFIQGYVLFSIRTSYIFVVLFYRKQMKQDTWNTH